MHLKKACKWLLGWLDFNVGLEIRIGLIMTVWDSSHRMVRRLAIKILIPQGGDDSPTFVPPKI